MIETFQNLLIGFGIIAGCIVMVRLYSEYQKYHINKRLDAERLLHVRLEEQNLQAARAQEDYETKRNRFLSSFGPNDGSKRPPK